MNEPGTYGAPCGKLNEQRLSVAYEKARARDCFYDAFVNGNVETLSGLLDHAMNYLRDALGTNSQSEDMERDAISRHVVLLVVNADICGMQAALAAFMVAMPLWAYGRCIDNNVMYRVYYFIRFYLEPHYDLFACGVVYKPEKLANRAAVDYVSCMTIRTQLTQEEYLACFNAITPE